MYTGVVDTVEAGRPARGYSLARPLTGLIASYGYNDRQTPDALMPRPTYACPAP